MEKKVMNVAIKHILEEIMKGGEEFYSSFSFLVNFLYSYPLSPPTTTYQISQLILVQQKGDLYAYIYTPPPLFTLFNTQLLERSKKSFHWFIPETRRMRLTTKIAGPYSPMSVVLFSRYITL